MENSLFVTREDGTEEEMSILFTFETDNEDSYVIFHPVNDEENFMCARFDDDEELDFDLSDEELEMCEEILNSFLESNGFEVNEA